jgi:IS5 family transposase
MANFLIEAHNTTTPSRGNLKSTYGYSVHMGVNEDGFIQRQTVTAGNVHDSVERETLLLGDETDLYRRPEPFRRRPT